MTTNNIYNKIAGQSYVSGFGQGVFAGFCYGYEYRNLEATAQTKSEDSYLFIAKKHLNRKNNIMENYEISNEEEILSFFDDNSSIVPLVKDTYFKIHEFIPNVQKIVLDVLADPENGKKNLVAKIYPQLSFDKAMDHLDMFERQWFAEQFTESEMTFNVLLDFE